MQFLNRNEKIMTQEEKIKLDLTRILVVAQGVNIRDINQDINLTDTAPSAIIADLILRKFNLSYKNQEDSKIFFPEKDTSWPGQVEFEKKMTNILDKKEFEKNNMMYDKNLKLRIIDNLNLGKSKAVIIEDKEVEKNKKPKGAKKNDSIDEDKSKNR